MRDILRRWRAKEPADGTWGDGLPHLYPDPNKWDKATPIQKQEVFRFAQQWLTEGVPYAFHREPMVYERARERMARKLEVSPKAISMTGSARLGYSLGGAFGKPFDDLHSDLDLFVVSENLFEKLALDGRLFASRVFSGEAEPNTELEKKWWQETANRMETQIVDKRYLDHKLLPRRERYDTVTTISQSMIVFANSANLNSRSARTWSGDDLSVRVYRDWEAAMRKIGGSVLLALRSQGFVLSKE